MKTYGNARNLLTGAVITALNPLASTAIYRTAMAGTGGGKVRGVGAYTGQNDAVFDVEIVNATITGTPRISQPVHTGVGNPSITGVTADGGTAAQSFTITLADLGTETRQAYTPFQGFTLRAKLAGEDGNAIQISISEAGLVRTATQSALIADLIGGTNEYTGDEWDFVGKPRNVDGTIPTNTSRISFGDDPQVYRQYKVFTAGQYLYSFTPAPLRTVAKGAKVFNVTGGRTLSVTHATGAAAPAFVPMAVYALGDVVKPTTPTGHWYECTDDGTASTEPAWSTTGGSVTTGTATFIDRGQYLRSYADIVTLFDALTAIQGDAASLIEVVQPVVNDLTYGGMGITDLSVRTGAFIQSIARDGTDAIRSGVLQFAVNPTAPTEELTIRCAIGDQINQETWDVRGSVSGLLAQAVTGIPYDGADYDFTIPLLPLPAVAPMADKSTDYIPINNAIDPRVSPCISNFVLGALATQDTFTFKYEKRGTVCDCDTATVQGGPNPGYLGTDPGVDAMDDIPTELQTRIADIWDYYDGFISLKTSLAVPDPIVLPVEHAPDSPTDYVELNQFISADMRAAVTDIAAVKNGVSMFATTLYALHAKYGDDGIPSGVTDAFDAVFDGFKADFDVIDSTVGNFWRILALSTTPAGTVSGSETVVMNRRLFTQEFAAYMQRYKVKLETVLIAAGIQPPFDSPTDTGTGPWVDHNEEGWFVATDSDLKPIQPGWYYHSAEERTDEDGNVYYVSTQQFGIGVAFGDGCVPAPGDVLVIKIGNTGTSDGGYQQGDRYTVYVVKGSPAQLGGGQIGTDTQIFSVVGSVAGALADYELLKTAPPVYSDGGISFTITPGPSPSQLGDRFVFFVEGGQFQWRKTLVGDTPGGWTGPVQIAATVALSDGVSAAFDPGAAPSFVTGDSYTIAADAVNGGAHLQSLTYGGITTTQITESMVVKHRIDVRPAVASSAAAALILFRDPGEVGATVTVRGYADVADAEGTEITTGTALTNGSPGLHIPLSVPTAVCEKYTVTYYSTANTGTTVPWRWLYIGDGFEMTVATSNGIVDDGDVAQTFRRPRKTGRRSYMGVQVEFDLVSQQAVEDFRYLMDYAAGADDDRVAIMVRPAVPPPSGLKDRFGTALTAYPEISIVTIPDDTIEVEDYKFFQPAASQSVLKLLLRMDPVL